MHFVQWHSVPARRRSSISLVFIVLKQLFAISVYLVIIFLNFFLPIYEIYTFFFLNLKGKQLSEFHLHCRIKSESEERGGGKKMGSVQKSAERSE